MPAPVVCTGTEVPAASAGGLALLIRSDRYCAAVSPGRAALSRAAAPVTSGAEKLVPSASLINPVGPYRNENGFVLWVAVYKYAPVAARSGLIPESGVGPRLEKDAMVFASRISGLVVN